MRSLSLIVASVFLILACGEDDCYYCSEDVTNGMRPDSDVAVIPKDTGAAVPDRTVFPDTATPNDDLEQPDEVVLPEENMVLIEATTFMMGCDDGSMPYCTETNATPYHEVSLLGFYIDLYEVTRADFESCINAGACRQQLGGIVHFHIADDEHPFCVLKGPYDADLPANCVSWHGAREYCEWLEKRLPTEAEWELAARGDDERIYPWGDTPPPSCDNVIMEGAADWGCDGGLSVAVGTRSSGKSPYGLYDMAGNVWEWAEDDWHDDYDAADRPDDGTAWVDASRPANRVIRGGSFMIGSDEPFEFTTYGHYGAPADDPGVSRGFRCAR